MAKNINMSDYHLEDMESIWNYQRWIRCQKKKHEVKVTLGYQPKFSVVIPVYNTVTEQLREAIDSVLAQSYTNYELILVDDHSSWESVVPVLKSYEKNSHVQVIYRETNGHISIATNDGIQRASGDYIVFMDCDDTIEPDAFYEFAKKLNENPELDFIYSDEDKITEDGMIRHMPHFKPEWSPDLFMNMMYTNHLAIYRASIVKEIGGLRTEYNGSQDYDMTLRFMEKTDNTKVGHISKVLYHWRERKESAAFEASAKNYAAEAAKNAKIDALRRRNIAGHLECINVMEQYRVVYDAVGEPFVSIIIPSKDHPDILMQCINSIREYTDYPNYEVIVVDNGSNEGNRKVIETYLSSVGATYLYDTFEFNFSKMCNMGADASKGEYLLFLNDDVEIFQRDWLNRMVGQALQKHTGAVGAKLYFPGGTLIQHAGVANLKDGPAHSFITLDDSVPYSFGYNWVDYNCSAVTAACLLLKKEIFCQVGGFDETLPVAYNDVDLCFKIHNAGYYNVIRNDVKAYHHESLSRGNDLADAAKFLRLSGELQELYHKHPEFKNHDPYLNKNLERRKHILALNDKYEMLDLTNIGKAVHATTGNVDRVVVTDRIQIFGWSCLPERTDNLELERYLVFEDPYKRKYKAPVNTTVRPDVVEALGGREDLLYSGFECTIDKSVLKVDLFRYKIGILTIDKEGKSHILWTPVLTDIVQNQAMYAKYSDFETLAQEETYTSKKRISCNLEEVEEDEKGYCMKGWAFCDGNNHYLYKKEIILKDKNGQMMLFETMEEKRLDVAAAFSQIHYLYNAGFRCNIYKNNLEAGMEYDVILRMRNLFDENDVNDVMTGRKICKM